MFAAKSKETKEPRPRVYRPPQSVVWINGWPAVGKHTVAQCLAQILGNERAVLIDDQTFTDQLALPPEAHILPGVRGGGGGGEKTDKGGGSSDGGDGGMEARHARLAVANDGLSASLREKQEACFREHVEDPDALHRVVIFTDCCADDAAGAAGARRYAEAARRAGRPFVPVYMECRRDEHERRSRTSERRGSLSGGAAGGGSSVALDSAAGAGTGAGSTGAGTSSTAAVRALQAQTGGQLYAFPAHEWPGLYVNVTDQGMHETAMEILTFINQVSEKRNDAVAATAAAAASRRPGAR